MDPRAGDLRYPGLVVRRRAFGDSRERPLRTALCRPRAVSASRSSACAWLRWSRWSSQSRRVVSQTSTSTVRGSRPCVDVRRVSDAILVAVGGVDWKSWYAIVARVVVGVIGLLLPLGMGLLSRA